MSRPLKLTLIVVGSLVAFIAIPTLIMYAVTTPAQRAQWRKEQQERRAAAQLAEAVHAQEEKRQAAEAAQRAEQEKAAKAAATAASQRNDAARAVCKDYVRDRLKSPRSADFPLLDWDIAKLSNGTYRVRSYVDAQNSFGANIRTRFACTVLVTDADHYQGVVTDFSQFR
jgi:hypothetical protein